MQSDPPTTTEKSALAPDLRSMPARAARAWAERMAVRPLDGWRYAVDSQSDATYVVDLDERSCTCADHQIRGETCKHLRRVALEITSRRVPPPGRRRADCAVCGREAFVPTDTRPAICDACRFDAGEIVRDRETGDRLVVRRVTDRRADDVVVPSTGRTVADHPTNDGYPEDDFVVEVVYASDLTRGDDPRVYSFPNSRLEPVDDAELIS